MRLGTVAIVLLMTSNAPAAAQHLDPLSDALHTLPETILSNPEPHQAVFVNIGALLELTARQGVKLTPRSMARLQISTMLRPIEALHYASPDDWKEKAGIGLEEIRYFTGFGEPPNTVTIWGLKDGAAADRLVEALPDRGFMPMGIEGVLGNGEPHAADLARRDPTDPWRSQIGAATFVAAKDNVVVQSSAPESLPEVVSNTPSVGDNPVIAAAMAGLEGTIGDHLIVQAMLISPVFGLEGFNPANLLTSQSQDFEALKNDLEAASKGIPPYLGGIISDAHLDRPVVAISLTYTDCSTAETAADLIEQRWIETMPEVAQGTISSGTVPSSDGLCAATLTITDDSSDYTVNPIFDALFRAYMQRSFTVLQIGETS